MVGYTPPSNLPDNVDPIDLQPLLPRDLFEQLLANGEKELVGFITHLADYARFLVVDKTTHQFAWIVDCDTIWLRAAVLHLKDTSYGHGFATLSPGLQHNENLLRAGSGVVLGMDLRVGSS